MDLICRKVIAGLEGEHYKEEVLQEYVDPDSERYARMNEVIRQDMNFTSLRYHRLDDMIEAVGISPCKLCTYCWNGKDA